MAVEIRKPDLSSYEPLVQLRLERVPRLRRVQAEWGFLHSDELALFEVRAAYDDGELAGWVSAVQGTWFPPMLAMVHVTMARAHERKGIGGALFEATVAALPAAIDTIGTGVDDKDEESLAIALGHGFDVTQHGIESELALNDLPEPAPSAGVTFDDVSTLEFADEEAVEAMLADSQTNPEAEEGFVTRLDDFRKTAANVERPVSALARVDGAPAAIVVGEVDDGVLGIAYTGVGRAFRGRGLAFALKQDSHRLAAEGGATVCHTTNEESNVGIRRVNARLGYQVTGGHYRLRRRR
jgi:GNAT superfamily N-acetyltransferase